MNKIYLRDVPLNLTTFSYIREVSDWRETARKCRPSRKYPDVIEFESSWIDFTKLRESVSDGFKTFGEYGWIRTSGENNTYTGVSLVYNPDHQDGINIHQSTLGTPKNDVGQYFWNKTDGHAVKKNSYFDTYGFRLPTPFAQTGYVGELLQSFNLSPIRSRVSNIHAIEPVVKVANPDDPIKNPQGYDKRWHKDETIFENVRMNIPIQSAPEFMFELDGHDPQHLEVGKLYTWDTYKEHGVFALENTGACRTHMVLGFSPWWRYDAQDESWNKNEFYGKHPWDMYYDGDICSKLVMSNL